MPKRYQHYMKKRSKSVYPHTIITVDVYAEQDQDCDGAALRSERFRSAAIRVAKTSTAQLHRAWDCEVYSQPEAWSIITQLCCEHPGVQVWSYGCYRTWTLLGMWSMLEDRRLLFGRGDALAHEDYVQRAARWRRQHGNALGDIPGGALQESIERDEGFLIVGDPPNIAQLIVAETGKRLNWYDLRNHGWEMTAQTKRGREAARWSEDRIAEMLDASRQLAMGGLCPTASGQALTAFRTTHYHGGILCHTDETAGALERDAYFGGRCEAYRIGRAPELVYEVDVRQCYPSAMMISSVPERLRGIIGEPPVDDLYDLTCNNLVIADVTVSTDKPAYPHRLGSVVCWPVGTFRTTLCGPELDLAIDSGHVMRCHAAACYSGDEALASYARAIVTSCEDAEQKGNKGLRTWLKRVANSLVGKLGQRERIWVDCPDESADAPYSEWMGPVVDGHPTKMRSIAWRVQQETIGDWSADSCPAIAAWITSYARCQLWRLLNTAGRDNVIYCDTDSLYCTETGLLRLLEHPGLIGPDVGQLRVVGGPCDMWVGGPKLYEFGGKIAAAGQARGEQVGAVDAGMSWHYRTLSGDIAAKRRPQAVVERCRIVAPESYRLGTVGEGGKVSPFVLGGE